MDDLSSPSVSVVPPSEGTTTDAVVVKSEAQALQHDDVTTLPLLLFNNGFEGNNDASRPEIVSNGEAVVKKVASTKNPQKKSAMSVSVERIRKEVEEQQKIVEMLQSQKAARDLQMATLRSAFATMMSTRADVHVNAKEEHSTHSGDENAIGADAKNESNLEETKENADTNADSIVAEEECAEHDNHQQQQEHPSSISPMGVNPNALVHVGQILQSHSGARGEATTEELIEMQEGEEEHKLAGTQTKATGGGSEAMTTLIEALKMYVKGREVDLSNREFSMPTGNNTTHTRKQEGNNKGKGGAINANDEELRLLREEESALLELLALKKARREAKERRWQAKSAKKNKQRASLAKVTATSASVPRAEGDEAEGERNTMTRGDAINHSRLISARRTSSSSSTHSRAPSSSCEYEEDFESFANEEEKDEEDTNKERNGKKEREVHGGGGGGLSVVEEIASISKYGTPPSTTFDENMFGKLLEDLAKEIETQRKPVGLGWLED